MNANNTIPPADAIAGPPGHPMACGKLFQPRIAMKQERLLPGANAARLAGKPVLLAVLLAGAASARAMDASERAFIWNEGNARMAAADSPEAYRQTAQTYQKLVDAGVRNGPLFYNLGTALLQAGQYDRAIDALARAERFLGRQPDIRRNLSIAMDRKQKTAGIEWPWYRIPLFWHFDLSTATRTFITASAFTLFWLALILRRLGIKRATGAAATLALLAFVAFGSSVATSAHQEATAPSHAPPSTLPGK